MTGNREQENRELLEEIGQSNLSASQIVAKLYLVVVNSFGSPSDYMLDQGVVSDIDFQFAFEQLNAIEALSNELAAREAEAGNPPFSEAAVSTDSVKAHNASTERGSKRLMSAGRPELSSDLSLAIQALI